MKWLAFFVFLMIPFTAFSMGIIVNFESPLIETESTSPRFEAMGGISVGVDDPEGDFRINPAKSGLLNKSIFYSYPRISILTNKQKEYDTGDGYRYNYESSYFRTAVIPEPGFLVFNENGLFYGVRTDYEFGYTYYLDKSSSTGQYSSNYYIDRIKHLSHSVPLSLVFGKKMEKSSLGVETGVRYSSTDTDTMGDDFYGPPKQKESGVDLWVKPGILIFADASTRFSIFLETYVYSKGKFTVKDVTGGISGTFEESYDIKNEKVNGEIDIIKDFEKVSFGCVLGFFSEKIKMSMSENGVTSSFSYTRKEGFKIGAGVSSKITSTTLLGSDIIYSLFDSDLPSGTLPVSEYVTFSKIESDNIQWKAGVEQRVGDNYYLRFGYAMIWNIVDSHYSDFEESSGSSGYKFIYNAVTSGFSYEKGKVRFDYLLRFNNIFSIVNSEIVNTFGIVITI